LPRIAPCKPRLAISRSTVQRATVKPSRRNCRPAAFLKLLVLLVPREMKVEHSGGVKAMTDAQLEAGIEAIQAMLAARDAGANAEVIEAVEESPSPGELEGPKPRRTRRKAGRDVGSDVGTAPDEAIS
jgi:hypothetical protein